MIRFAVMVVGTLLLTLIGCGAATERQREKRELSPCRCGGQACDCTPENCGPARGCILVQTIEGGFTCFRTD